MGRSLSPPTAKLREMTAVVPTNKGGTGADNAIDAAANIGAISTALLGLPGGVAVLNNFARIPSQNLPSSLTPGVTLSGSRSLYIGQVATYTISNYDASTSYTVSASNGTITRSGATITYTAPGVAGNYTITVNGRSVTVNVTTIRPAKPVIAGSSSGNSTTANLILSSSVFAMQSGAGTHLSSDWEVSTSPTFNQVAASTYNDTVNKTGFTATALAFNTCYYARVRHRDSTGQVSDWSSPGVVTTLTKYVPSNEEAKLVPLVTGSTTTESLFGTQITISADGTRVAVGNFSAADGGTTACGVVYVYIRSGGTWVREATLVASDKSASAYFGWSLSFNSDASRIAIGAYQRSATYSNQGAVYVFRRTDAVWEQEQVLVAGDASAASEAMGYSVSMSADGNYIAAGAHRKTTSQSNQGAVYIFSRAGTTWTQQAKLIQADPVANSYFGCSVCIVADGSRVAIGAYNTTATGTTTAGAVYVFKRTGTTWAVESKLIASDKASGSMFGGLVSMDVDGTRVAIAAQGSTVTALATAGAVYVFKRDDVTWVQEAKINAPTPTTTSGFGSGLAMSDNGSLIFVGEWKSDPTAVSDAGTGYMFTRTDSTWNHSVTVTASDKVASNRYGTCVALSADGSRAGVIATRGPNPYVVAAYILN